ncbi:hypothetical protein KUCAC02_001389 [Chaenocephalus aceratus]|uniref:Uncharacterized protein n=1 Tax=Chaenocephalus aceratus TaxID=36190 RepID=A0ACB9XRF7_CHAAC|nr:hypothetical protein KUCAC02_001389 [Chaenocephalus aceratus]
MISQILFNLFYHAKLVKSKEQAYKQWYCYAHIYIYIYGKLLRRNTQHFKVCIFCK